MLKFSHVGLAILGLGLIKGCAPALFMGATTGVATSAADERGLGGVLTDTQIKARIVSLYAESKYSLNSNIDVVVREGKVLLTGIIDAPAARIEAVRLAWVAKGVKEVHDEIQVGHDKGVKTAANDTWISTKLKTKMLFDQKISSINYNLHTIDGVVYLMGIAQDQAELDYVVKLARHTPKVKQVVSYVHISKMAAPHTAHVTPKHPAHAHHSAHTAEPATPVSVPFKANDRSMSEAPSSLAHPNSDSAFN